jgi:hypothetical protein
MEKQQHMKGEKEKSTGRKTPEPEGDINKGTDERARVSWNQGM